MGCRLRRVRRSSPPAGGTHLMSVSSEKPGPTTGSRGGFRRPLRAEPASPQAGRRRHGPGGSGRTRQRHRRHRLQVRRTDPDPRVHHARRRAHGARGRRRSTSTSSRPTREHGSVMLSRQKALQLEVWRDIERAFESDGAVEGAIVGKVKGGLKVDIGVPAFLPGSHADIRPARNLDRYIGQRGRFAVLKFNRSRGNVVVSRRAVLERERDAAQGRDAQGARGGRHPRGHREEHHRLRRLRRPRRHRRPAARHRHVVGAASAIRPRW